MTTPRKRVIICAERRFPRGDAGANRVQYISRALMQAGHEVIVVSIGENRLQDYCAESGLYIYDQVKYRNVPVRKGFFNRLDANIVSGFTTIKIIKEIGLTSSDFVIIYTSNPIYGQIVCNYCNGKIGADVAMDVVENFQPFQYRFGLLNPRYWLFSYCFNILYPRTGKVIAISRHLANRFKGMNLCVLRLPPLIDPTACDVGKPLDDDIIRIIYSGQIGRKEAFVVMLEGFLKLSDIEKNRVKFYITRTTKAELRAILEEKAALIEQMGQMLHIKEWMSYESLMSLYGKIDFLFFARYENEVTLSNFPSKVPELLACGIPTIANRVGDFAEHLQDGINSILFDECTALECCTAIRRALNMDRAERNAMRASARRCSEEHFDFRVWADKLHEFVQTQ